MSHLPELTGAIALTLLILWFLRRNGQGSANTQSVQQALVACEQLLLLAAQLQQHRGMSSALLAGDQSFRSRLQSKGREIEQLFHDLQQSAATECLQATPCFTVHDVSMFRFKWRSLIEALPTLTVERSIAEHSQLVATVLEWLDALGESRVGLVLGNTLPQGLVKNYAHRLPALTECLGQARALGSSVAAQGQCSAVARVRLMFLVSRAESLLQQASAANGDGHRQQEAQRLVEALADLIRSRLLVPEGVSSLTADGYFSQATGAIDSVFSWIRECRQHLEQRVQNPAMVAGGQLQAH